METLFIGYDDGLIRSSDDRATSRRVLDGVPVPMVAADPEVPSRVYAATLGRGLLKSDDGGSTFTRVPTVRHDLVWSVAVSCSDRHGGFGAVYAGTQMSAVYRSVDGGQQFVELDAVQALPSKPSWSFPPIPGTHHVHQIALSHEDPGVVVFGVELGGVFRSTDRGDSWVTTNADPDPHVLHTHPTASGRMYQGGGTGFYASTDAGVTWARNLSGMPAGVRYFYGLAVDPVNSDTVLIVGARDPYGGHAFFPGVEVWSSVFRLRDGTWAEVTAGLPPREGTAMGTLAAAGPGTFYYVTEPGELYRSDDAGVSFEHVDDRGGRERGTKARWLSVHRT